MKKIFFTGEKGIGKSKLLEKVIKNIDCSIGGFIQEKEFTEGVKIFKVISLYNSDDNYIIGRYDIKKEKMYIDMDIFNVIANDVLLKSLYNRDLVVLDELGFMEENVSLFKDTIFKILNSDKPVIGVLRECDGDFVQKIAKREDVQVIRIDENNRNFMEGKILRTLQENNVRLKKNIS
ncbi:MULTISPECIES: nucleoside-triphosphatase [Clostridium]|nr:MULTISPECIES: nucleoside-triphosphatase [Clostridium]AGY78027.1 nucleoside-triphosphatase [Clostridium autoethanogenum DSM 10061]ALU38161.1 NTPase [Clostridium autoethanogenum DSM 10061]OAA85977.1 NTPase [Clostridium ljungdahlii DSM 13528]OVY50925.1 NTPase [Clostridium autoethanogenum]